MKPKPSTSKPRKRKKPPKLMTLTTVQIAKAKLAWIQAQLNDVAIHNGTDEWRPWALKRVKELRAEINTTGIDISTLI